MSVRKYIHPRNKYKTPPDYKKLAIKYPEFRQIAITDLAGRVRIDFQNEKSLRTLTETLLMHDFDLHVRIPSDKLSPTITLRMNYILWIEDLMNHFKLEMDKVKGIDIGTGATCIYALLLAKIYGCHMTGTEVDEISVEHAQDCVNRNNLGDLIKVVAVNPARIFQDAIGCDTYDFSMCNPPFFESEDDAERVAKALPPRNASTGNDSELKTVGGERAFVTRMIDESIEMGDRIKIYSTMIGKKIDLIRLKMEITSRGTTNLTWTEFCQGHTTRWGLAWSFLPRSVVDLTTAPVIRKNGKSMVQPIKSILKKETSITFSTKDKFSCMDDLISSLTATMKELNITLYDVPVCKDTFNGWMCRIIARERSWEHARRKRRLALRQGASKRLNNGDSKCIDGNANDEDMSSAVSITEEANGTRQAGKSSDAASSVITTGESNAETAGGESSEEKVLVERIPVLSCKLCVGTESSECETDDVFKIWMIYENGTGGLDALHSLRQYLINQLGVRGKALGNSSKASKRKKKRKKARKDLAGTSFAPITQSRTDNEDSKKEEEEEEEEEGDNSDDC